MQIRGVVQGVWYRKSCREKALELELAGIVKNMPDGSVYCKVEGEIDPLMAFIEWCKQGPPMAKVEKVTVINGPLKNYKSFEILR